MTAPRNGPEIIAAGVVTALGLGAVWVASDYPMGTLTRMGPGYVPIALGVILAVLGVTIAAGNRSAERVRLDASLRPFVFILGGILLWALIVDRLGFIAATAVLVVCCASVERGTTPISILALVAGLCAAGYLIFIEGLGIPLSTFGD